MINRAYTLFMLDEEYYKKIQFSFNKLLDKIEMRLAVNKALGHLNDSHKLKK